MEMLPDYFGDVGSRWSGDKHV